MASNATSESGTFTIPADGYYNLEIHGSGGAGGSWYSSGNTTRAGRAGGGSGAYIDNVHLTAGNYSYSVGAGGSPADGYPSAFGDYTVNGGGAGRRSSVGAVGTYTDGMTNMATASCGNSCYGTTYGNGGRGGYTANGVGYDPEAGYAGAIIIECASSENSAGLYLGADMLESWENLDLVMEDLSYTCINNNTLYKYGNGTKLIFPRNRICSLGDYAFNGCSTLNEVVISDGVQTIGAYAFAQCTGLVTIRIPNSVTSIKTYAFEGIGTYDKYCDIIFDGTREQWDAIAKEDYWALNAYLTLHCTDYNPLAD